MGKVRGKFNVVSIKHMASVGTYAEITLTAVYSGNPEDNTYSAATPSGSIVMTITNPSAIESLPLGKSFYVDFTQVDE